VRAVVADLAAVGQGAYRVEHLDGRARQGRVGARRFGTDGGDGLLPRTAPTARLDFPDGRRLESIGIEYYLYIVRSRNGFDTPEVVPRRPFCGAAFVPTSCPATSCGNPKKSCGRAQKGEPGYRKLPEILLLASPLWKL
jgi:hypothetical protein